MSFYFPFPPVVKGEREIGPEKTRRPAESSSVSTERTIFVGPATSTKPKPQGANFK